MICISIIELAFFFLSTVFKGSGSFFALYLADICFEMTRLGGANLFFYVPAFMLVATAVIVVSSSAVEFFSIFEVVDDGDGENKLQ